jgi:ABC-type glycerol-3-phosphate transport system permease component
MGFNRRKMEDQRRQAAEKEAAVRRATDAQVLEWNYMMATAIVYALPPVAIYYAFRRRMTAGLTMGGVKG